MRLFKNLKARILKNINTWSAIGKQTAQAKEVYLSDVNFRALVGGYTLCVVRLLIG